MQEKLQKKATQFQPLTKHVNQGSLNETLEAEINDCIYIFATYMYQYE